MRFALESLSPETRTAFEQDLFAIADSKFVLGNWYAICILNGRSLPDFAAITAMTGVAYGHTRAIWQYLVNFGHSYGWIERGRGPDDIRSMNLLDAPPKNWTDFLASTWLAEQALWMAASGFLKCPDRVLAGLAEKIGEEVYFHLKYFEGWMQIFADSPRDRKAFAAALDRRYPLALSWFGPSRSKDLLHEAGLRDVPMNKLREAFAAEIRKGSAWLDGADELPAAAVALDHWNPARRRAGDLPDRLYEAIRFKDSEAAH